MASTSASVRPSLVHSNSLLDGNSSLGSRSRNTSETESFSSSTTTSSAGVQHRMLTPNHHQSNGDLGHSVRVYLYADNDYVVEPVSDDETVESLCHRLCKRLRFKPVVELLFGLRNVEDGCFVPACRHMRPLKGPFEFRLRFKMPDNTKLKALDKHAFEYYYMQVRHDLIKCKYPGINYEEQNEKILGLAVADMYLELIKNQTPVDELCRQYKRFTPKPNQRFAKKKIKDILRNVRKDYDQFYIMESYLSQINTIGPFYLKEEYSGETDYTENELGNSLNHGSTPSVTLSTASGGTTRELLQRPRNLFTRSTKCALKVELCPEYRKEAVLKILFKHTDSVSCELK